MCIRSLPRTVKIRVIPTLYYASGNGVRKLVRMIVKDYCRGFNVCVVKPYDLYVVFAPDIQDKESGTWNTQLAGLHVKYDGEKPECVIMLNTVVMNDAPSRDTLITLIHEVIHYCQVITDRHQSDYEPKKYSYHPSELEAHGLQEHYLNLWHKNTA
jgi:hypothetical protein